MMESRKEQHLEERIQDLEIMIAMLTRQLAELINKQAKKDRTAFAQAWLSEPEYMSKLANG